MRARAKLYCIQIIFMIRPSESSRERVKVSHVIVECRVINPHPPHHIVWLVIVKNDSLIVKSAPHSGVQTS